MRRAKNGEEQCEQNEARKKRGGAVRAERGTQKREENEARLLPFQFSNSSNFANNDAVRL